VTRLLLIFFLALATACSSGTLDPVHFDAAVEPCRFCRMTGSDGRTAAQLVAPGQEAQFFDDIGCLRDYLRQRGTAPGDSVAFVADHRTGEWVRADQALYTRHDTLKTPMSSHLAAHATRESRDGDATVSGGTPVTPAEVFGSLLPGGTR
jgi:copper chaperone NosL